MFRLLENWEKQHPGRPLPAVYTMVFYHGVKTPYPYSLSLWDCFDDPLQLMPNILYQPIPLIDVANLSDEELKQLAWVGPVARAIKHVRESDVVPYILEILEDIVRLHGPDMPTRFIKLLINYLLSVGAIPDPKRLYEGAQQQLSQPIWREIMTGAKTLREAALEEGLEKGRLDGQKDIALKLLQEGVDHAFISKVTELSIEEIKSLKSAE